MSARQYVLVTNLEITLEKVGADQCVTTGSDGQLLLPLSTFTFIN